jgi:putative transposase
MKYLVLDARYEKVRHGGSIVDCSVLIAIGVDTEGRRSVLGVSVSLSEAEVHWREFFKSLLERGLHGVELITSDAHAGLKEARKAPEDECATSLALGPSERRFGLRRWRRSGIHTIVR